MVEQWIELQRDVEFAPFFIRTRQADRRLQKAYNLFHVLRLKADLIEATSVLMRCLMR